MKFKYLILVCLTILCIQTSFCTQSKQLFELVAKEGNGNKNVNNAPIGGKSIFDTFSDSDGGNISNDKKIESTGNLNQYPVAFSQKTEKLVTPPQENKAAKKNSQKRVKKFNKESYYSHRIKFIFNQKSKK
jgi:hypothetical protein